MGFVSDNLINYSTGPIKVKLDIGLDSLVIWTTAASQDSLTLFRSHSNEAWGVKEADLVVESRSRYRIKLNYVILKNFLERSVVYLA